MYNQDSPGDVRERRSFERKLYRGGRKYPCPDCGEANTLTAGEVAQHYHCNACTARAEAGY